MFFNVNFNLLKVSLVASMFFSSIAVGSDESIDFDEMLLDTLEEVSSIATKTKLNIDEMPAFVTILRQNELFEMGIESVYEALGLVPGVELSIEASGAKQVVFRGVKEKGKINLMIDGIKINNAYRGSIYHYLDFPVELIDRIEVIRGPGSVIYGSNAIVGVINIITLNSIDGGNSSIFTQTGSYDSLKGGFHVVKDLDFLHVSMDSYYQKNNKAIVVGPDKAGLYGDTDESLKDYAVGLHVNSGNFNLNARLKKSDIGLYYGIGNYLTPDDNSEYSVNKTQFLELSYQNELNSKNSYSVNLGLSKYEQYVSTRFAPMFGGITYKTDYAEKSRYVKTDFKTKQIKKHDIVVGAEYIKSSSLREKINITNHPLLNPTYLIDPNINREIFSLYVNDQIEVTDRLDISAGIRYDNYTDFGDAISPRVGLVYALSDSTNIKTMYSNAFRAPSWVELYADIPGISTGESSLNAETSDTFEIGFVHKFSKESKLRFNMYETHISDVIYRDTSKKYVQSGNNEIYGGELDFDTKLFSNSKLSMNVSYVTIKDKDENTLPDIANTMSNINFLHTFVNGLASNTHLKYTGKRERSSTDTREDLASYIVVNQTLSYRYKTMLFNASVKNLFDEEIYHPADVNTYVNDYLREGRSFWVGAKWNF